MTVNHLNNDPPINNQITIKTFINFSDNEKILCSEPVEIKVTMFFLDIQPLLEFSKILNCINSIVQISTKNGNNIFQSDGKLILDFPTIQINFQEEFINPNKITANLYLIDNEKLSISEFLESRSETNFNPTARYLFVGERFEAIDAEKLSKEFMMNTIFLNRETGEINTFFPYEFSDVQNISTELKKIGHCNAEGVVMDNGYLSLFPEKYPAFWKNSTILLLYNYEPPYAISTTGDKKGIEIELLDLILTVINITGIYTQRIGFYDNSSLVLMNHEFDVFFGNFGPQQSQHNDYTVTYTQDSVHWFVPQPKMIPKWKFVYRAFSKYVWISWVSSTLITSIFWYITHVILKNQSHPKSLIQGILMVLRLFIEQPGRNQIKLLSQGILVFLMIQSTLVLNILYKAKYTYFLSGRNYDKTVNTIEYIMTNDLKIGTNKYQAGYYNDDPIMKKYIDENFVLCDTSATCVNQTATGRKIAVLKPDRKVAYISNSFLDCDGYPLIHKIPQPVVIVLKSFCFSVGHPVAPIFNRYLQYTVDHGFVEKILDKYDRMLEIKPQAVKIVRMNFDNVKAPFFILMVGYFSALCVCIIEIFLGTTPSTSRNI
ncbi:hypothetical protein HHI36_021515 [Cryptolaemus montrouzieri]|uniref:Ionotropic receptor n=1 Tax=Cryptolaemus montrouzieri TaxID=559131 RepID=A0ABD2MX72_9CUCU